MGKIGTGGGAARRFTQAAEDAQGGDGSNKKEQDCKETDRKENETVILRSARARLEGWPRHP